MHFSCVCEWQWASLYLRFDYYLGFASGFVHFYERPLRLQWLVSQCTIRFRNMFFYTIHRHQFSHIFFLSDISIFTSIMPFMTLSAVEGIPHATYFCVEFDPHLYIVWLSAQELLPADYMQYVNRIANQQQPFLCVYLSVAIGLGEVDEVSYTNSNQRTHTRTHTHMDVL